MPDERRKRVILNDRNGYVIQRLKPILYTWDEAAFKNVVVITLVLSCQECK